MQILLHKDRVHTFTANLKVITRTELPDPFTITYLVRILLQIHKWVTKVKTRELK